MKHKRLYTKALLTPSRLALGVSAALFSVAFSQTSFAASVTCNNVLYYCATSDQDDVTVTTTAAGATSPLAGFGAYLNSATYRLHAVDITTSGSAADGIRINSEAALFVADTLTINTTGSSADGINVASDFNNAYNSVVYIKGESNISTVNGVAVRANNYRNAAANSIVILAGKSIINVTGTATATNSTDSTGYGVYAGNRDYDTNGLGFSDLLAGKNNNTLGNSYVFIGDDSEISTKTSKGYAVYANKGGTIQLGDNVTISTTGSNATAIYASTEQQGTYTDNIRPGHVYFTGGATISAGNSSYVMQANGAGSIIASQYMPIPVISDAYQRWDSLDIQPTNLTASEGVFDITGNMLASSQGTIQLNTIGASNIRGDILATTSGTVTLDMKDTTAVIGNASSDNATTTLTMADSATMVGNLSATNAGTLTLTMADATALTGNASSSNSDTLLNISMTNNASMTGNLSATNGGQLNMTMADNTLFTGKSTVDADSILNLSIDSSSRGWMMTGSSTVTALNLTNGAAVVFGDQSIPVTQSNAMTLTTDTLTGDGHFFMRTNVIGTGNGAQNIGDLLAINQASSGTHAMTFNDSSTGGLAIDGTEKLKVVQDTTSGNDTATFTSNGVDYGPYVFHLEKQGTDWYLVTTPIPEPEPGPDPDPEPEPPAPKPEDPPFNDPADHAANILNINYLMNYVEIQTLLQRMGELRDAPGTDGNGWARIYGGRLNSFDNRLSGFSMNYHGLQFGVDKRFENDKDRFYLGMMAGTGKANPNYKKGDGDTRSYHVGIYGTYMADNGFYADAILKYSRMKNSFNAVTTSIEAKVNGDGNTNGFALGIEAGKRFYTKQPQEGFYIEPQAQLTYSHQGSTKVNATNDLTAELESFNSLLGRVSAIFGYSVKKDRNPVDIYFKTGYVKEFKGDTGFKFNDNIRTHEKYDFGGGWWDNGIGVNMQFNKVHNIYLDINYAKGSRFNQKQINFGYRYQF